ncbi:hypothetical protein BH11MYX3_BH11MYX3_16390 [soil metagenome]
MFAAGLVAAVIGMNRYGEAYTWVAHTSDVRLVLGRAVGHAGHTFSCEGLRQDITELESLVADNAVQQRRTPALRGSIERQCSGQVAPSIVGQLSELDETERELMAERRERLADTRRLAITSFVLSTLGAMAAVIVAGLVQRRANRAIGESEERFRLLASSSRDLIRIHDAAGRPTYVSPSVEKLLGYTPAELLAEVPLALGHPDDTERMRQSLADVQEPHAPASTLVYRLRARDGTFRSFETHTNPIRDRDGNLLRFYTTARDVTDRVELEQKLEAAAVKDELTGLLNRRGFMLIANQEHRLAVRSKLGVAVIYADLDGLKPINDRLGHEYGDRAICQVARILSETFRDSDVVARLGGDEFAAFLHNVDQATVESALERLRFAIAGSPPIESYPLAVSLGMSLLAPGATTTLDELLADADQRMYEDKRARKPVTANAG